MNTSRYTILPAIVMTVFLAPFTAFPQNNQTSTLVDTLARRLAIKNQLQKPPQAIKDQFKQNPLQLPAEKNKKLLHLFDKAYHSNLLLRDFKSALRQKMSVQHAKEVTNWLNKPEAGAITRADQEYYSLQGKRKRLIRMYKMDQQKPPAQRGKLIAAIVDSSAASDAVVASSVIILRSLIKATNKLSEKRNFSDDQVDAIVQNFKMQLQARQRQQLNREMMLRYYDVKTTALKKYLSFIKSDRGQWLTKAIHQSMQQAYQKATKRFANSLNQIS